MLFRSVNDLSKKNGQDLPFIKLEDSSEAGLFEYCFLNPEGELIFEGKLQDKDYYIVGAHELKDLDEKFIEGLYAALTSQPAPDQPDASVLINNPLAPKSGGLLG